MDPLKPAQEQIINIQDQQQQEKKINHEQIEILRQAHLADILLFGALTLNPQQQELQNKLQEQYLKNLKPGDKVEIGLQGMMPYHQGIVTENSGEIVKVQANCYLNKKKENGIRSFSTANGLSRGFLIEEDGYTTDKIKHFFIVTPESNTVKSTAGLPKEARDEIYELYKKAGRDSQTCYDLVDNLNQKQKSNLPF